MVDDPNVKDSTFSLEGKDFARNVDWFRQYLRANDIVTHGASELGAAPFGGMKAAT